MKPLDALCGDTTCICHERPDQPWWIEQVHNEQNSEEWLDGIARELVEQGHPFKRWGGDCDYDGLMESLWRRMCEIRGLTPVEWAPETVEEKSFRKHVKRRSNPRRPVGSRARLNVYARDNYECVQCGSHEDLTLDHVVAVANGGTNEIENLQTMCRSCNSRKGVKSWQSAGSPSSPSSSTPSSPMSGPEMSESV